MIVECQDVATSAVTRDFQCFLSLASLRLVSQAERQLTWHAYEGRWGPGRASVVKERLCFRCQGSNVLVAGYHQWEINNTEDGAQPESWSEWPMSCRSRWT